LLGVGAGIFGPGGHITRQDLATTVLLYAQHSNLRLPEQGGAPPFADDDAIAGCAREAMHAMRDAGIITGKPGNMADPLGEATRAEVAAVIRRLAEAAN
jgi:hypothetical protein